jgi:hypothetical protein
VSLRDLIRDSGAAIDAIASFLDGLSPEARLAETRTLDRDAQRELYRKAKSAAPLSLDDFVPKGTAARMEIIHHGKNTLPLPGWGRLFQKRFCRPEAGEGRLFGYNESPFKRLIGPGYFVTVPTAGNAAWEARGAVVVDYYQVPDGPVADGWPKVVPNTQGLQRYVFHKTRDFMRRVSAHVSIGAAFKKETALDHYFVLCREPHSA